MRKFLVVQRGINEERRGGDLFFPLFEPRGGNVAPPRIEKFNKKQYFPGNKSREGTIATRIPRENLSLSSRFLTWGGSVGTHSNRIVNFLGQLSASTYSTSWPKTSFFPLLPRSESRNIPCVHRSYKSRCIILEEKTRLVTRYIKRLEHRRRCVYIYV